MPSLITRSRGEVVRRYLEYNDNFDLIAIHDAADVELVEGQLEVGPDENVVRFLIPVHSTYYGADVIDTMSAIRKMLLCVSSSELESTVLLRNARENSALQREILNRYICMQLLEGKGSIAGRYYRNHDGSLTFNIETLEPLVFTESGEADVYI